MSLRFSPETYFLQRTVFRSTHRHSCPVLFIPMLGLTLALTSWIAMAQAFSSIKSFIPHSDFGDDHILSAFSLDGSHD